MKRNTAHKQAQRAHRTLAACERCGATEKLQRHHPDYNQPKMIVVLCPSCHGKEHKPRNPRVCVICETTFYHGHSRAKTCSRECLTELGRRNQAKRKTHGNRYTTAAPSTPDRTAPATPDAETPSPPTSPSGSAEG